MVPESSAPRITLRPATLADMPAVNDIYNYYIAHSTCTYLEEPEALDTRIAWFHRHNVAYPAIVAVEGSEIVGWASLCPFKPLRAYRQTVEDSVYVRHDRHRRGIGSMMLTELIQRARQVNHRCILASIDAEQAASLALHARHGFAPCAHMRSFGQKFDRWLDLISMQLLLW